MLDLEFRDPIGAVSASKIRACWREDRCLALLNEPGSPSMLKKTNTASSISQKDNLALQTWGSTLQKTAFKLRSTRYNCRGNEVQGVASNLFEVIGFVASSIARALNAWIGHRRRPPNPRGARMVLAKLAPAPSGEGWCEGRHKAAPPLESNGRIAAADHGRRIGLRTADRSRFPRMRATCPERAGCGVHPHPSPLPDGEGARLTMYTP
jgi:hypothetical protein